MPRKDDLTSALQQVLDEHDHGALGGRDLAEALADAALGALSIAVVTVPARSVTTGTQAVHQESVWSETSESSVVAALADDLEAATGGRDAETTESERRAWAIAGHLERDREAVKAERDAALAAIERVRAIHAPFEMAGGREFCGECSGAAGSGYRIPWPCSTIQVLDGAPEAPATEPEPNQYAPCFINGNRSLSILGTINSVREYAENETQMLRDNEAAYPNGTPEAIVLAARYVGPWLPVEGESDGA